MTGGFDHDRFWQWVRKVSATNPVFVSEYTAPDDFEVIWQAATKSSLSANGKSGGSKSSVEKLFVYKGKTVKDVAKLEKLLKKAKDCYYNTGKFYKATKDEVPADLLPAFSAHKTRGVITDAVYDELEVHLKAIKPTSPVLKTGAPVVKTGETKKLRVQIPFPMPSLNKANLESLERWLAKHPGPYCASDTVDGVSIGIEERRNGTFATTRGDGRIGGDISFMVDALKIPVMEVGEKVRGEIVMYSGDFKTYAKQFANPRNMVSGITNRNSLHPALAKCKVLAYESIAPRLAPSKAFKQLKTNGFHVPGFKVFPDGTSPETFMKYLKERKAKALYDIDGIVIAQDKANPIARDNPDWAVALKDFEGNAALQTTVTEVQWQMGRTGILFPRIMFKPIQLGGATVTYCSGKSADFIEQNKIGPGTIIKVAKSGDVIPDLREVVKPTRAQLPDKNEFPNLERKGANFVLPKQHHGNHPVMQVKRIANFFSVLGIKNFKVATIEKFMDAGYENLAAILNMDEDEFLSVPGTSAKVLKVVFDQLDDLCSDLPQTTAMLASGCFEGSVGTTMIGKLAKYPCVTMPAPKLKDALYNDDSLTDREYNLLLRGLKEFRSWLRGVDIKVNDTPAKPRKPVKGKLTGKIFVFTGVRDKELEEAIEAKGGKIGNSVVKDSVLIVKDVNSTSAKAVKAEQLGIPIMTLQQAQKAYG